MLVPFFPAWGFDSAYSITKLISTWYPGHLFVCVHPSNGQNHFYTFLPFIFLGSQNSNSDLKNLIFLDKSAWIWRFCTLWFFYKNLPAGPCKIPFSHLCFQNFIFYQKVEKSHLGPFWTILLRLGFAFDLILGWLKILGKNTTARSTFQLGWKCQNVIFQFPPPGKMTTSSNFFVFQSTNFKKFFPPRFPYIVRPKPSL